MRLNVPTLLSDPRVKSLSERELTLYLALGQAVCDPRGHAIPAQAFDQVCAKCQATKPQLAHLNELNLLILPGEFDEGPVWWLTPKQAFGCEVFLENP
jgi:hypothetical protein